MEILTGDGRVVTATPGGEHADLFRGFPNSYGTLGYALSLTIELEPVQPYVHLRHLRFGDPRGLHGGDRARSPTTAATAGHRADFLDGTVFGPDELYLTVGAFARRRRGVSDYTGSRSTTGRSSGAADFLTIRDYLWRWDTDWFWCSRAFGVQNPLVRRLWPRRLPPLGRLPQARRASTAGTG